MTKPEYLCKEKLSSIFGINLHMTEYASRMYQVCFQTDSLLLDQEVFVRGGADQVMKAIDSWLKTIVVGSVYYKNLQKEIKELNEKLEKEIARNAELRDYELFYRMYKRRDF